MPVKSLPRFLAAAAALCTALALAACGGSSETPDTGVMPADGTPVRAYAGHPFNVGPTILTQPPSATVGTGAGVSFSVIARAGAFNFITGFRWRLNGMTVAQGLSSSYSIPAVGAQHLGSYTVEVLSTNGDVTSAPATLSMVAGNWAQLGGRVIVSGGASQQPALSLCDGPKLARIEANAAGIDELRVSRFNGTGWSSLGGVLNVSATAGAADPSIDCSDVSGMPRPVVAWSEGIGNARAIQVKTWNGSAWVAVGSVGTAIGANARKPVLRLAPANANLLTVGPIRTMSAIAWVNNGVAGAKFWNGVAWSAYAGGFPSGSSLTGLALTLDLVEKSGGVERYPPLIASVASLSAGRTSVVAQTNMGGWASLGLPPSAISPATSPLKVAGIGFGTDRSGTGAVAVWTAGSATYSIGSSQLFGSEYKSELLTPLAAAPAWGAHANVISGTELHAVSFDSTERRSTQCSDLATRPTFALAVNDWRGTSVMMGRCNGRSTDPLDWFGVQRTHARAATALSLKMETDTVPVFAAVELVNGRYDLSVWKFYP